MVIILRYVAAYLITGGFLAVLVYRLSQGASAEEIRDLYRAPVFFLGPLLAPQGTTIWNRGLQLLMVPITIGWLWFLPPEYQKPFIFIVLVALAALGAGRLSIFARRRWPFLRKPAVTVTVTTIAVCIGIITALYLISRLPLSPIDWHSLFVTNWYVTLVILYLPLMGLVWMGLTVRQRFKTSKKPDA